MAGYSTFSRLLVFTILFVVIPWLVVVYRHGVYNKLEDIQGHKVAVPVIKKKRSTGTNTIPLDSPTLLEDKELMTLYCPNDSTFYRYPQYEKPVYKNTPPVTGPLPNNGAVPFFGEHTGSDAVFALASSLKYDLKYYKWFVGSLRRAGFTGDIVLAVSPPEKIRKEVERYLRAAGIVAYGFDVDCEGIDNCRLQDNFLGYPDPRPFRPFANIRYALYEHWLRHYPDNAYILILDFRDTFFQLNPFASLGPIETRPSKFDLRLYAENEKVKRIGNCVFNSMWISRCFGKSALPPLKSMPVICSGSTMGSVLAMRHYIPTMLRSMDTVKCWQRGIESDQGYQNFLFYNGYFNSELGNATLHLQGEDVVNTIGAMNGKRVPDNLKGSLADHWKIRDSEGFILNYDGTRSACVHQWDRWYLEMKKFMEQYMGGSK